MPENFQLHQQLHNDCFVVGDFEINRVLLINNNQLPWFILVPRITDATELYLLPQQIQNKIQTESRVFATVLMEHYQGDKLNIATIGNLVPQLHIHHIVRYHTDPCWPGVVWGQLPPSPYSDHEKQHALAKAEKILTTVKDLLNEGYFRV